MESRIRRTIVAQVRDLPTLPGILHRILEIASDDRSSADDIAEAIKADHALSAKILKIINSAFYGLAHKISNIRHAVSMLGFRAIKNIILSISIYDSFIREEKHGGLDKPVFWQHAIAAGTCAYQLARRLDYPEPEEAYTAGLLHDIGKVVLDKFMKEAYFKVLSALETGQGEICEVERLVLGVTHAEVGGLVAEKWNFPERLTTAIRCHHVPDLSEIEDPLARQLAAMVAVSDYLCWDRGYGSHPFPGRPRLSPQCLEAIPIASVDAEEVALEIERELGRASEIFRLRPPTPGELARELGRAGEPLAHLGDLSEKISRELEERALEISLVGEVVERIRKMTDVDEIVRTFLGSCRSRLSFDRVFWFAADGERTLRLAYVLDKAGLRQPREEGTLSLDDSPDAGPIETAAITGKPFIASVDGEPGRDEWAKGARELGGAPLATSDQLLGVVVVDNSLTGSPLTEMSVQTLHLLAIEVALVIEKSHLLARWRQTERLARTDELTGLANRRQVLAAIEAEIAKSRERGHSLALVLVDLDNFKEYNDRFGHDAGDRILVGVAERIEKRSREYDTVARLGGDEYAVVLPRASIEEARRFAHRILQDVETYGQELQTEFPGGALSLSAGVALFDPEADDGKTLLKRADEALYRAKAQGKGRIE